MTKKELWSPSSNVEAALVSTPTASALDTSWGPTTLLRHCLLDSIRFLRERAPAPRSLPPLQANGKPRFHLYFWGTSCKQRFQWFPPVQDASHQVQTVTCASDQLAINRVLMTFCLFDYSNPFTHLVTIKKDMAQQQMWRQTGWVLNKGASALVESAASTGALKTFWFTPPGSSLTLSS